MVICCKAFGRPRHTIGPCITSVFKDTYFYGMVVNQIHPSELQFNTANVFDTEAPFLDLHLLISGDIFKMYDKRDYFDFDNVNFLFLN